MNSADRDTLISYSFSFFGKGNFAEFLHPTGGILEEHVNIIG